MTSTEPETTTNQVRNIPKPDILALIQNYFADSTQVEHVLPDGLIQKVILQAGEQDSPLLNINCNVHYICYGKFIVRQEDLATYEDMITEEERQLSNGPMGIEKMYEDLRQQPISTKANKAHKASMFKQICINSMKEDEIALFLIHPKYMFGEEQSEAVPLGGNIRIPPKSPFVYYFEIKKVLEYRKPNATNYKESIDNATFEREQSNKLYQAKKFKEALTGYRRGVLELNRIVDMDKLKDDAEYARKLGQERSKITLNICRCHLAMENYGDLTEEIRKSIGSKKEEACDAELFFLRAKGNFAQTAHLISLEDALKHDIERAISNCTANSMEVPNKYLELKKEIFNFFGHLKVDDSKLKQFAKNIFSNSNGIFDEEEEAALREKKELETLDELDRLHKEDMELGRTPWFVSDGSVVFE